MFHKYVLKFSNGKYMSEIFISAVTKNFSCQICIFFFQIPDEFSMEYPINRECVCISLVDVKPRTLENSLKILDGFLTDFSHTR